MAQVTTPFKQATLPIRMLSARVVEGPDCGTAQIVMDEAISAGTAQGNGLTLTDPTVSRFHAEFSRAPDGIRVVDQGSTNGTFVGTVRVERATVAPGTVVRIGRTSVEVTDGDKASVDIHAGSPPAGLVGNTPAMRRLVASIYKAASLPVSVLVVGESGTGKELIARALHDLGPRASGPFVTVDCGALPAGLISSELFGHEKGAFTGAERQHLGAFERASGGTLFLDEIGELPQALQTPLLGALERRQFRRVGGQTEISVDVRVVCATNRDLRAEVNAGSFRLDLYYRLAVMVLKVAALRDRKDDIPLLVEHFLRECGHHGDLEDAIGTSTMQSFTVHSWPGNVRELRNAVELTLATGEAPEADPAISGVATSADPIARVLHLPYREARSALVREFEERFLRRLMDASNGNVSLASRSARIDRSHLDDLLKRHGLR